MNEKELKEMIAGILTEMVADNQAVSTATVTAEEKPVTTNVTETTEIEEGLIPDITEVDLRKQLLLKNAVDPEALLKMKAFSPARLGVGRAGTRYMTSSTLRFRADHAAAQDAVFSDVSEDLVKEMNFISTKTICNSKDEYLTRPDYGRQFDEENSEIIRKNTTPKAKIQMVVGDGLSSAAIEANIKEVLPAIKQGLNMYNLDFDNVVFVKYCRVPAMDKIGEITDADVVCLLVGERPGLVTAESMSAYIAYKPTVGMPEARRTVISNIHKGGTPAVEAGAYIAEIIKKMLDKKKSGIDLKEAE
ncbi:ethanolamine ammonia-lyase subunit EutC [Enterococcus faecalis]|uniref:ethanolamine ammonia-lyase subunit EutC n=1 Tax=Enterococcus TaxID=1350 RepID=UPI0001E1A087|nr:MULTISPECIES: ethanolamine ammonia-lyase subunit EutC [Enterococcus]MDU7686240.1 ethanolamine ammonia-lyase subunit EutC [Bacillota bacterium]AQL53661.1 ethanolamine ammonia-lyase [Enterococcus faecalis]AXG88489.1 ethanolamine ammonia-lyase subunit EutC [Enterococcus faecalis]AYZ07982.1 ethanolamine ammonia-lyase subunit EutC [Enterococcus faecalis]EFM74587.1 ethanolamine ammonia-lyase, light subunit [Enterococcus faecalis TX0860]